MLLNRASPAMRAASLIQQMATSNRRRGSSITTRYCVLMTKAELQNLVIDYADAYSIDRAIALAQAQRESGFNPGAVGKDGARGIMQILPSTWPSWSSGASWDQAFDPDYNLTTWGNYMQWLLNRYGWDYRKALQGYNGGPGHVDRGDVSQMARDYAEWILTNSGRQNVSGNAGGVLSPVADSVPSSDSTIFGLPIVLALAIGATGLYLALRD